MAAVRQPELFKQQVHAPRKVPSAESVEMSLMLEVFLDGELAIEAGALKRHTDVLPDRVRLAGNIQPQECDRAGLQRQRRAEQAEQRGLAAAIGPQQSKDLPRRHLERDSRQRAALSIAVFDC